MVNGSDAESATPSGGEPGSIGIAIAMYCVLLAAYVLMAADRFLFPMLAPDVRRDYGFSLADSGLLSTIFTLGLGVGGLPTGYCAALLAGACCWQAWCLSRRPP
jgi:MFS family permease